MLNYNDYKCLKHHIEKINSEIKTEIIEKKYDFKITAMTYDDRKAMERNLQTLDLISSNLDTTVKAIDLYMETYDEK